MNLIAAQVKQEILEKEELYLTKIKQIGKNQAFYQKVGNNLGDI